MARKLKVSVGGLNIRIHPHSEELYNELMQNLYSLKRVVRIRGDRFGMITNLARQGDSGGILRGVIRTFTKINPNGPWFDEMSLEDADDNTMRKISILPNVHPNSELSDSLSISESTSLRLNTMLMASSLHPTVRLRSFVG